MKKLRDFVVVTIFVMGIISLTGCKEEEDPVLPTLTTTPVTEITPNTAKSGGSISDDGGAEITERGVCWSTTQEPTVTNSHTTDGTGTGDFTSTLNSMAPGSTYFVRAYATNIAGTAYGNEVTFSTTQISAPSITTTALSAVTVNSAATGGSITSDGGTPITQSGVCWDISPNPTIESNVTTDAVSDSVFTSNITGLTPGTVYYVRAYAVNSQGTSYGNEYIFSTSIADIQGNVYKTAIIGTKLWMAENLRTTRYRNNVAIRYVPDSLIWMTLETQAYSWYRNNLANGQQFGALYNWYTVSTGILCPDGWHVPTQTEFQTFEVQVGVPADSVQLWGWRGKGVGTKLKDSITWNTGNGNNETGMSIRGSGYRAWANSQYRGIGEHTYFWTATDDSPNGKDSVAWYRRIDGSSTMIYNGTTRKAGGKSIRCIKN